MFGIYGSQLVILYFALFTVAMLIITTVIDVAYGFYLNRKFRKKKAKNPAKQDPQVEEDRQP
jgi:positive regulator of sigma E activity